MSQKKLIHGFHAVNARLFQSPKSLIEIYITRGREDRRMQEALDDLWPYTGEMFAADASSSRTSTARAP